MTSDNFDPAEGNPFVESGDNTPGESESQGAGWFTLARRRWIYRIVSSLLAILAVYVGIETPMIDLWLNFVAAALALTGTGATMLAHANLK